MAELAPVWTLGTLRCSPESWVPVLPGRHLPTNHSPLAAAASHHQDPCACVPWAPSDRLSISVPICPSFLVSRFLAIDKYFFLRVFIGSFLGRRLHQLPVPPTGYDARFGAWPRARSKLCSRNRRHSNTSAPQRVSACPLPDEIPKPQPPTHPPLAWLSRVHLWSLQHPRSASAEKTPSFGHQPTRSLSPSIPRKATGPPTGSSSPPDRPPLATPDVPRDRRTAAPASSRASPTQRAIDLS